MKTKWNFYKFKKLTVFGVSLKNMAMGCKDVVLPKPLLINCTINCLTFERTQDNHIMTICVFFKILLSICSEINDWKKKHQKLSTLSSTERMESVPISSREFTRTISQMLRNSNIFIILYVLDILHGNIIGELARGGVQKNEKTVQLKRYNNHVCYLSIIK